LIFEGRRRLSSLHRCHAGRRLRASRARHEIAGGQSSKCQAGTCHARFLDHHRSIARRHFHWPSSTAIAWRRSARS